MNDLLKQAGDDLGKLLAQLPDMTPPLQGLGQAMMKCWGAAGKVLLAGNGGSAADAMHLAEELSIRYMKNRKALAAVALCDPTVITCCANDFGFDAVFARQVEAIGNPGDILIVFSTSGNSTNIVRAINQAKAQQVVTASFLGKDGGKAKGLCDIEIIVPSPITARIQEVHQVLFHVLCEWIDQQVA